MVILPVEKRLNWSSPPYILLLIIALNVFIFFFYQLNDPKKIATASEIYTEARLFELEWPAYQKYLDANKKQEQKEWLQDQLKLDMYPLVSEALLMDRGFYPYLLNHPKEIGGADYDRWFEVRRGVNKWVEKTSVVRYGLVPSELGLLTLVSHQFMHGGLMHLLGNLFFLIVCGFAVEAAIGHLRFLIFYLLSGIAGGVGHALLDLSSIQPLVGASGAISGVMAMYLGVFRLKKIEFFYWFYIFVGYFKAPALLILPLYLIKELHGLLGAESNVAYMAHIGGFCAGAILIIALLLFNKNLLNEEYVEQDQSLDEERVIHNQILNALESFNFEKALKLLNSEIENNPSGRFINEQKYLLIKLRVWLNDKSVEPEVNQFLQSKHDGEAHLLKQQAIWRLMQNKFVINNDVALQLAIRFCSLADVSDAESIYKQRKEAGCTDTRMLILAGKLSYFFQSYGNKKKADYYQRQAEAPTSL